MELPRREFRVPLPLASNQCRSRVAGCASKSRCQGNALLERDSSPLASIRQLLRRAQGIEYKVGPPVQIRAQTFDNKLVSGGKGERVAEVDRKKNRRQFVETVGAFAEYFQAEVELGRGGDADGWRGDRAAHDARFAFAAGAGMTAVIQGNSGTQRGFQDRLVRSLFEFALTG